MNIQRKGALQMYIDPLIPTFHPL
ncbi:hypothetical protein CBM2637_A200504 [Cupriavidus taiwanensis]|nr:hypothetical protein CBM2637_A200504 [Cupriavidus taiwanensis]